jgi:hypothetical protein
LSSQRVDAGAVELLWAEIINYPRAGEAAAGFHYVSTTVASRRRAALIFLGANELIDWLYVSGLMVLPNYTTFQICSTVTSLWHLTDDAYHRSPAPADL